MAQYVYLSTILDYIERGGGSRGSYLICHDEGEQATSRASTRISLHR